MNRLTLDLGTHTGWASYIDGSIQSGVQDFSLKRGESPGMRFIMFRSWLKKMLKVVQPDIVVYEQPHHRGGAATELLVGFSTRVMEMCARYEVEHAGVHTATLKKWATGNGRASKEDMIKRANMFPNVAITDDNEADALCLLFYSLKEWPDG